METLTLEQAYYIGELLGVFAIVASLIYLALQLRQRTKLIRLSTLHHISSLYVSVMDMHSHNQEASDLWFKGLNDFDNLNQGQRTRFMIFMGATMRILNEQFYQWQEGALDKQIWQGMKGPIDDIAQHSGFKAYWEIRCHQFSESFQEYVDESIKRVPLTTKPMYG
jgi:hypothetical protein